MALFSVTQILNDIQFQQSHKHTDIKLLLGYLGIFVAASTVGWSYKVGFEQSKNFVWGGVILYAVLSAVQVGYTQYVEGGKIYEGKRKSLSKRVSGCGAPFSSSSSSSSSSSGCSISSVLYFLPSFLFLWCIISFFPFSLHEMASYLVPQRGGGWNLVINYEKLIRTPLFGYPPPLFSSDSSDRNRTHHRLLSFETFIPFKSTPLLPNDHVPALCKQQQVPHPSEEASLLTRILRFRRSTGWDRAEQVK